MKPEARRLRDELGAVFGLTEGPVDTATVLSKTPTSTLAAGAGIAERCPMNGVLRDFGAVAARAIATELLASGLRPPDFANQADMAQAARARVLALLDNPEGQREFDQAVLHHLRLQG